MGLLVGGSCCWLLLLLCQSGFKFSSCEHNLSIDSELSRIFRCQNANSPHFVLFFTIWKRLSLVRLVIQHHSQLRQHFRGTISLWLVGSQGKLSNQLANNLSGVYYTECPNYPISDKHNCGLQRLDCLTCINCIIVIGFHESIS
ncbi:hypothetical protein Gasu2_07780 [Galdieria sulphuraria]|nr:hypothetical protein Gasu2_07780 [Galdieria sulphuraria]